MESDSKFSMNKQINPAIFAFLNKKTYFRPGLSIQNGAGAASVPWVRTQGMPAFGTSWGTGVMASVRMPGLRF